jgi:uncharacterized protein (UPF0179 family)
MRIETHRDHLRHCHVVRIEVADVDIESAPLHIIQEMQTAQTLGQHLRSLAALADSMESDVVVDFAELLMQAREAIIRAHRIPTSRAVRYADVHEIGDYIEPDEPKALPPPQKLIGPGGS